MEIGRDLRKDLGYSNQPFTLAHIYIKVYDMITRIPLLNYGFSQKLKMLGNDEFNHLTIILIPSHLWA